MVRGVFSCSLWLLLVVVHGLLIVVASHCRAQALGCAGFSGGGTWAQ